MRRAILTIIAMACLSPAAMAMNRAVDHGSSACGGGAKRMARVELYFGAGRASRSAWIGFLAQVVTPRFPAGFTTFDGFGQWRGPAGTIAAEPTHILIVYYRPDATSAARIEAIRTIYKRQFRQRSVLRADATGCVSF